MAKRDRFRTARTYAEAIESLIFQADSMTPPSMAASYQLIGHVFDVEWKQVEKDVDEARKKSAAP